MRPTPSTLKLPAKLVNELGGYDSLSGRRKTPHNVNSRKDRRKADRVQKKVQRNGPPLFKRQRLHHSDHTDDGYDGFKARDNLPRLPPPRGSALGDSVSLKPILKIAKPPKEPAEEVTRVATSLPLPKKLPRTVATKFEQDDAEIAALEKKLGIKNKKRLPQAFKDDGLDNLLEGLDQDDDTSSYAGNTDPITRDWLAEKRSRTNLGLASERRDRGKVGVSRDGKSAIFEASSEDDLFDGVEEDGISESSNDTAEESEDIFEGFSSQSDENSLSLPPPRRKQDPFVAPTLNGDRAHTKYVPHSLRTPPSGSEALVRLRRQTQGLINRLTEANLISILGDIERIYRENARQHVTSTLVDLLLISVCEHTSLPDTLIILPAGFIAAAYRVIGTDFGAHVVERVVELFDEHYRRVMTATTGAKGDPELPVFDNGKETSNLITLLAELYNFQVISSNLMFDYIRLFLQTLSELNAELLLRIIRASGPQLRQDDPSSLRDIVAMLRPSVAELREQNLSVRTKYMIESINDLTNNRTKAGVAASSVISEHKIRMKKTIGSLNSRRVKTTEPLRIGLKDVQESDKRGRWWLVGASWTGNTSTGETNELGATHSQNAHRHDSIGTESSSSELLQLAREQRMNTDIRRAIFVTIMSASDYQDAYLRLMKLNLKKVQELEIPKVIICCSSAEKHYNPFYTLIAKKLCSDRRLRMAFQFSLWDTFKRLGDVNDNDGVGEDDGDEATLDTRQLVIQAKMFGGLIVEGGIGLNVLKNLNLRYLPPRAKMFVEVLLLTVLLYTQLQSPEKRDEQAVLRVFSKVKDTPSAIGGLRYFLTKVVAKTDIAGGDAELNTVRWACKVAAGVLDNLFIANVKQA